MVISFPQSAAGVRKAIRQNGWWCQVSIDLGGDHWASIRVSKKDALDMIAALGATDPVIASIDTKSRIVTIGRTAY